MAFDLGKFKKAEQAMAKGNVVGLSAPAQRATASSPSANPMKPRVQQQTIGR